MRLAIMQPTFLPWLGYFALIDRVDRFVYLDDVQLSRQSWQTRNRLKGPEGQVLLALPVARKPSQPLIRDARLAATGFEAKLVASVRHLLGRAPFGGLAVDILQRALDQCGGLLATLNIALIEAICDATGIATPRLRASDLAVTSEDRIARLVALCRATDCTAYLSPPGAADYLGQGAEFAAAGIDLAYLSYDHPEYPQFFPPFASHMAALDALAHFGPERFLPLVRSGVRPDIPAGKDTP